MDFFAKLLFGPRDRDAFLRSRERNTEEQLSKNGVDVFTDPMVLEQYIEQEMIKISKMFGFQEFDEFSVGIPHVSILEDPRPNESQDIRDKFLKKGYEKSTQNSIEKIDTDLDDKTLFDDMDPVLHRNFSPQISPYKRPEIKEFFYEKSVSTITHPDGCIETRCTVKDNEGNEETSVCHRNDLREYCVLRKRDKSGKEEVTEQFVNMDENERDLFTKHDRITSMAERPTDWKFPFDRFF